MPDALTIGIGLVVAFASASVVVRWRVRFVSHRSFSPARRPGLPAWLVGAAVAFYGVAPLAGQQPSDRRGVEISLGVGAGSLGTSCAGCVRVAHQSGISMHLWVGGPVRRDLLLGADIVRWSSPGGETATTMSSLMVSACYYPLVKSGWFFSGGIGVSNYDRSITRSASGIGLTFGTGVDIKVTRNLSLTPAARFLWGAPGDVSDNQQFIVVRGLKQNLIAVDLNASIRFPTTSQRERSVARRPRSFPAE